MEEFRVRLACINILICIKRISFYESILKKIGNVKDKKSIKFKQKINRNRRMMIIKKKKLKNYISKYLNDNLI